MKQPREQTRQRTTCEEWKSQLNASSVASEGAGVSSSEAASSSILDEIDVLTPRRSLNRMIKGCVIREDRADDDEIDLFPFLDAEHIRCPSSVL